MTTAHEQAVSTLENVLHELRESPKASEVFVMVKIDGEYHRYSSGLDDLMQLVATLELAKFDALNRMHS
jgi:hypothetical protein